MKRALIKSKKFIDEVKKAGIPVSRAYLFGSRAKGKARKDSDIDVAVISPAFGKDYFEEMGHLRDIALKIDDMIEPHPFNIKDLNDRYSTLAAEIRKYGILI